ncbi:response regulator receiver domain [Neorhizobium tomejilense]|uniref:response regulator receiver domain n=1 Tax=Neorhizobium tomejilense TaxID=2093828 RepID=UPI000CFA6DD6|nr:response regulator receiver domain [Neorhizobium tomejilense]
MTFEEQCNSAAANFLQTAVLVDDQAEFGVSAPLAPASEGDEFIEPDELAGAVAAISQPAQAIRDRLDAGAITQGFAEKGLICSVLKPKSSASITVEVLRLAPKSDIIVLDWQMGSVDNGDIALGLIHNVLEMDRRGGGRLRLFAIYTGVRDLTAVSTRISEELPSLTSSTNQFEFYNAYATAKVVVLGKGIPADHEAGQGDRCTEEDGLAERLISEFARFSGGILRNATLASMGHLRSNTHRLLARLNGDLDGPVVTHFALLNNSADAQQYIADLILQEIEAQVPLEEIVAKYAGPDSIKKRIKQLFADGGRSRIVLDSENATMHDLPEASAMALVDGSVEALKLHIEDFAEALGKKAKDIAGQFGPDSLPRRLYGVLGDDLPDGVRKHEDFAIASTIRLTNVEAQNFRDRKHPTIRLGSIIHDADGYHICLTPVCDSVRLDGDKAQFLFGRLGEDEKKFNVIVDDGGVRKRLLIDRKNVFVKTLELIPSADHTVRVERKLFDYLVPVYSPDGTKEFVRWVAEMKPMQAQRVVGSVTSNLSRIGLDEFEWLRQLGVNWSG